MGVAAGVNVVVVSGDKDFQQLVRPGVWLLNPGRGGPAAVDEQWVGLENGAERLGVPPDRTIDYLALVGDASDNVPGVKGIGEKTAQQLIAEFGDLETILAHAADLKEKRPREALLAHADDARLSKDLVTIRRDLDVPLDLERLRLEEPDRERLQQLYVELEFTGLAREVATAAAAAPAAASAARDRPATQYEVVDTVQGVQRLVARARKARTIALDTETVIDPDAPFKVDPLRSRLVGISIALAPGEAYYLPFAHRPWTPAQSELGFGEAGEAPNAGEADGGARADDPSRVEMVGADASVEGMLDLGGAPAAPAPKKAAARKSAKKTPASELAGAGIAGRLLSERTYAVRNLPPLLGDEMAPLRALLEDATVSKTLQNAKYDVLVLRRAGVTLRGVTFDTMLASYVLDPGRRSHGLDLLALEFLDHTMTSYEELVRQGARAAPLRRRADRGGARLLVRGRRHDAPPARAVRAAARGAGPHGALPRHRGAARRRARRDGVRTASRSTSRGSRRSRRASRPSASGWSRRSTSRRARSSTSTPTRSCARSCSTSSGCPRRSARRRDRPPTRACCRSSPTRDTSSRSC